MIDASLSQESIYVGIDVSKDVPCQPFLPGASIDFAGLTPCLTVDSALHGRNNHFAARQLLLPVRHLLRLPILRSTGPIAGQVELQDDRVVHDPVYRRRRSHGI